MSSMMTTLCIKCNAQGKRCLKRIAVASVLGLVLVCLMPAVWATHLPQVSKYDGRIQSVKYNEDDVVAIQAYPGLGTQIVFSVEEKILDIACGFSQGWEISEKRNVLYLKPRSIKVSDERVLVPKAGKWDTNLLVTTNKHLYAFDLHVLPEVTKGKHMSQKPGRTMRGHAGAIVPQKSDASTSAILQGHPVYRIQFYYPVTQTVKAKAVRYENAVQSRLSQKPRAMNWEYSMQVGKNAQSIVPALAYDDGRFTYFQFPNNQDFPAVFVSAADGSEHLVNTHVEASVSGEAEDLLVVHRVAPAMVLRSGPAIIRIYNDHFDLRGVPPHNGTSVQGLQRVLHASAQGEAL